MTPDEIKARLVELGLTQPILARMFKVSDSAINRILQGRSRSERIEQAIAKLLRIPVGEVFPLSETVNDREVLSA